MAASDSGLLCDFEGCVGDGKRPFEFCSAMIFAVIGPDVVPEAEDEDRE